MQEVSGGEVTPPRPSSGAAMKVCIPYRRDGIWADSSAKRGPRIEAPKWMCMALTTSFVGLVSAAGCALQELRGKSAFGPEYRHSGSRGEDEVRYNAVQGLELRWDKGITTSATYRRRDSDDGNGDNDNLVLFEVGYPLWKAKKKEDVLAKRVEQLERELKEMRSRPGSGTSWAPPNLENAAESVRVASAEENGIIGPSEKENNE